MLLSHIELVTQATAIIPRGSAFPAAEGPAEDVALVNGYTLLLDLGGRCGVMGESKGPLKGIRIVEIAGIGPGQLCGMLLADMGARIIRIERPMTGDLGISIPHQYNLMNRSRPIITADLGMPAAVDLVLELCQEADAIFEGFRPGVMERLGLGPDICLACNPKLVYGRMTGWGQDGPLANSVGHDTNYIALSGALHAIGTGDQNPPIPLNLIGDFGGGALYLAMGILAALIETGRSGKGQVVDAAMVDGAASMMTLFYGLIAGGLWSDDRGSNLLDGGAPFMQTYRTSDNKFVAVCAIENRFYRVLLEGLEMTDVNADDQHDRTAWPHLRLKFAQVFATRTREQWCEILEGSDACFAPVLSPAEALQHPHNQARETFVKLAGVTQPAPAPRFSRTPSQIQQPPAEPGSGNAELLQWGISEQRIRDLCEQGALVDNSSSALP